ncbi:MAG: DNA repair protein RecO [Saprospiraceae bacterium]
MLVKTRGIVFKAIKYSETSLIVDIYTEEKGLRKYIISGVRSKRGQGKASLLQVMSMVELVVYEREDRDLNRIKEIKAAYVFQSIPFELKKGAIGLFLAEIARKTIKEATPNPELFVFLWDTFLWLDQTLESVINVHLQFLIELSSFLGFIPGGEFSEETPLFDLQEGLFAANIPAHHHYLDESYSQLVHQLLESNLATCHTIPMTRAQRQNLIRHLLDYYRWHIEHFPDIHSHQILQEVLGGGR